MSLTGMYRLRSVTKVVWLGCGAIVWSSPAKADWDSLAWTSLGPNVGISHDAGVTSFLVGAEGSVGMSQDLFWGGGYVDAVYDTGSGDLRFSIGPEVGWFCLGLDAGLMVEVHEGKLQPGFVLRPLLAAVYAFPYARFGWRAEEAAGFSEFGVLFKYPLVAD
jgi:hypothetical protein